jgi:hypothetical protein
MDGQTFGFFVGAITNVDVGDNRRDSRVARWQDCKVHEYEIDTGAVYIRVMCDGVIPERAARVVQSREEGIKWRESKFAFLGRQVGFVFLASD